MGDEPGCLPSVATVGTREDFGALVRRLFLCADVTPQEVAVRTRAAAVPLAKTTIYEVWNGQRMPRKKWLQAVLDELEVPADDCAVWLAAWERVALAEDARGGAPSAREQAVAERAEAAEAALARARAQTVRTEADRAAMTKAAEAVLDAARQEVADARREAARAAETARTETARAEMLDAVHRRLCDELELIRDENRGLRESIASHRARHEDLAGRHAVLEREHEGLRRLAEAALNEVPDAAEPDPGSARGTLARMFSSRRKANRDPRWAAERKLELESWASRPRKHGPPGSAGGREPERDVEPPTARRVRPYVTGGEPSTTGENRRPPR
ncbi:hypothetical protein [Spirillospora sp. CA-294931]|uniref:hypothetical protein n=1 Tax=Spirillospora sp. CA-294931 TaxID=3240042 RepID=UPI003D8A93EB